MIVTVEEIEAGAREARPYIQAGGAVSSVNNMHARKAHAVRHPKSP
jgi:hypothetical protein